MGGILCAQTESRREHYGQRSPLKSIGAEAGMRSRVPQGTVDAVLFDMVEELI